MIEKSIRLSNHARDQLQFRGATEAEVIETVQREQWQPADLGRQECRRNFPFNSDWNGKRYNTKQVRPVFADETDEIIVVTVYVYYF